MLHPHDSQSKHVFLKIGVLLDYFRLVGYTVWIVMKRPTLWTKALLPPSVHPIPLFFTLLNFCSSISAFLKRFSLHTKVPRGEKKDFVRTFIDVKKILNFIVMIGIVHVSSKCSYICLLVAFAITRQITLSVNMSVSLDLCLRSTYFSWLQDCPSEYIYMYTKDN